MEVLCGIYCIENTINQKKYIGQSIDIYRRWKQHQSGTTGCAISTAIVKYGINNFSFKILELCNQQLLNEREVYWIEYYDTYNNGYNETKGGDNISNRVKTPIKAYDINGNYIKTYESLHEAARENNCSVSQIYNVLQHERITAGGLQFRYINDNMPILSVANRQGQIREIIQLDLDNNIIAEFKTIAEASRKTGAYAPSIGRVCRGIKNTTHGFKWQYKDNYLKSLEVNA